MPSQRPYFLSSFIAAFRQQTPSPAQPNKHPTGQGPNTPNTGSVSSSSAAAVSSSSPSSRAYSTSTAAAVTTGSTTAAVQASWTGGGAGGVPIPNAQQRRRGSDSSSEGFRDAIGADKWYIGGRTAGGEEKFFKLGVVRRVKSNDGLSLDRLSL